jgi:hypothetical protein
MPDLDPDFTATFFAKVVARPSNPSNRGIA